MDSVESSAMSKFFFNPNHDAHLGIKTHYAMNPLDTEVGDAVIYDSFDGHIEKRGGLLLWSIGRAILLGGRGVLFNVPQGKPLKRISEIEDIGLRTKLQEMLNLRGLVEREKLQLTRTNYGVLDGLEKTVLFLEHWHFTRNTYSFHFLCSKPLKGYEHAHEKAASDLALHGWCDCKGFPTREFNENLLIISLNSQRSKLPVYRAEQSSEWVVLKLCIHFLDQIRANEKGVIEDVDTEFLHDLRVASRKSRSILKLLRKSISPELYELGQTFLKMVGKATNQLRDLDVYLLQRMHYLEIIPPQHRSKLNPFFDSLVKKRTKSLLDIKSFLQSQAYQQGFREWQVGLKIAFNAVNSGVHSDEIEMADIAPAAQKPISLVAYRAMRKLLFRIIRNGQKIEKNSPDESLHDLRIECKKLRYMLDLYIPLNPKALKSTMRHIKQLQNVLGDFNDLSVQEIFFSTYTLELPSRFAARDDLLLGIGMLLANFHEKKQALRLRFFKEYRGLVIAGEEMVNTLEHWAYISKYL